MKRGEIWTVAASGYASKPRPAVVMQADLFLLTDWVTVCLITTDPEPAEDLLRIPIPPSSHNGLREPSMAMVDKLVTVPRAKLGDRTGELEAGPLARLEAALIVFLGLSESSS